MFQVVLADAFTAIDYIDEEFLFLRVVFRPDVNAPPVFADRVLRVLKKIAHHLKHSFGINRDRWHVLREFLVKHDTFLIEFFGQLVGCLIQNGMQILVDEPYLLWLEKSRTSFNMRSSLWPSLAASSKTWRSESGNFSCPVHYGHQSHFNGRKRISQLMHQ